MNDLIALLIPALQSAYVDTVNIKVLSYEADEIPLGIQVSPGRLTSTPSVKPVVDSVGSAIVEGKLSDKQPYLWSRSKGADSLNITSAALSLGKDLTNFKSLPATLYTATFPVGTDTGLIRQLALRLNSSVDCKIVAESEFPESCYGQNPFNQVYTNIANSESSDPRLFDPYQTSQTNPRKFRARTCAPGNITMSPWRASGHRQDISEEFWLDLQYTPETNSSGSNFTQFCQGKSTLGYFELPNYWNGHMAGDVLNRLPSPNDDNISYYHIDELFPEETLPDYEMPGVPGPFLTSIIAVFGNGNFFDTTASNSNYSSSDTILCRQLRRPFTGLYYDDFIPTGGGSDELWWNQSSPYLDCDPDGSSTSNDTFLNELLEWLPNFADPVKATAALTLANYYSNNAMLNLISGVGSVPLYYVPGMDMQKFAIPLPAMIIITVLLATQLVGLALLAHYASRHPTWTESLDAFALLRLGASIAEDVPLISALKAKEVKMLDEKPGWIGDVGGDEREIRGLALGGPGRVQVEQLYQLVSDREKGI